jgi:hypothetical protein
VVSGEAETGRNANDDRRRYKVVRLLDELMPIAATPQRSGVSFDIRLYFREDSNDRHLWAEVAFIDRDTGKLINTPETALPLDRPAAVSEFFNDIAERGFQLARQLRTEPPRSKVEPKADEG